MQTLHIEGYKKDIDLLDFFNDNYKTGLDFGFEDESSDEIENCFIRIYSSSTKYTLEKALVYFQRQ